MISKGIEIVLKAKNAMAAGISSASGVLSSFGGTLKNLGKKIAITFLGGSASITGFVAKAISSFAKQEAAERSLVAAMDAHGEAGRSLLPTLKEIASAIQKETGVADEATLAGMARLQMLGVQTDKLGEAAKATIALTNQGMGQEQAQRAVALAMQGNFAALTRHIPLLKEATSEAEKAQIVNDHLTRGYQKQKDELDTVGGRWGALKGDIGDVWEKMGEAIAQNDLLINALKRAQQAVQAFGQRVKEWTDGGGVTRLIFGFKIFGLEAAHQFEMLRDRWKLVWQIIKNEPRTVWEYIKNISKAYVGVIVESFRYLGDWAVAIWKKIRAPRSTFEPPSMDAYKAALIELADAAMAKDVQVSEATQKALNEMAEKQEEHNARIAELIQEQVEAVQAAADEKVEAEVEAMERIELAAESHAERMKAIRAQQVEDIKSELAEVEQAIKDSKDAESKAEKDAAKARELFLSADARRAEREREKQERREEAMIARALGKLDGDKTFTKGRVTGQALTRAQAIRDAQDAAAAEREKQAGLTDARDKLNAELADAAKKTAENTERMVESQNTLNAVLAGAGGA